MIGDIIPPRIKFVVGWNCKPLNACIVLFSNLKPKCSLGDEVNEIKFGIRLVLDANNGSD